MSGGYLSSNSLNNDHGLECYRDQVKRGYVFNAEDDTWKQLGFVGDVVLVDAVDQGLVNPELFSKLDGLSQIREDLLTLGLTKDKAYFYLFYSGDKLIKVTFEEGSVRIEVDRAALYRKMSSAPCYGLPGEVGQVGEDGRTGQLAPKERTFIANSSGQFEIPVPTPLPDQPISIRGFTFKQVFEALLDPISGELVDPDGGLLNVQFKDNVINGQLSNPKLKLKVRQRGPDGIDGTDGVNAIIAKSILPSAVRFTKALVSLYKPKVNGNLVNKFASLANIKNCVLHVSPSGVLGSEKYWAAAQMTVDDCKDIQYHSPAIDPLKPNLDLPSWTATDACYDLARQAMGYLDWQKQFDLPFDILADPDAESCSCKVPFWFCGNKGTMPCDGDIDLRIDADIQVTTTTSTSTTSSTTSTSSTSSTSSTTSHTTTPPGTTTPPTTPPHTTPTTTPPATTPPNDLSSSTSTSSTSSRAPDSSSSSTDSTSSFSASCPFVSGGSQVVSTSGTTVYGPFPLRPGGASASCCYGLMISWNFSWSGAAVGHSSIDISGPNFATSFCSSFGGPIHDGWTSPPTVPPHSGGGTYLTCDAADFLITVTNGHSSLMTGSITWSVVSQNTGCP